jgi:hypothetical protein
VLSGSPYNWEIGGLPCSKNATWGGLRCRGSRVTLLDLAGLGLEGTLAPALAGLELLEYVRLNDNNLSGAAPLARIPSGCFAGSFADSATQGCCFLLDCSNLASSVNKQAVLVSKQC